MKNLLFITLMSLTVIVTSSSQSNAQLFGGRSFKEIIGDGKKGPILIHRPQEQMSQFSVETRGGIDRNGNVYRGHASGHGSKSYLGKASKRIIGKNLYWCTHHRDYDGRQIPPRKIGPAPNSNPQTFVSPQQGYVPPQQKFIPQVPKYTPQQQMQLRQLQFNQQMLQRRMMERQAMMNSLKQLQQSTQRNPW